MKRFDLAIAWNWEFDEDFILGIEKECAARGVTTYQITPKNLQTVLEEIDAGLLSFNVFYDRASDADDGFLPLVERMQKMVVKTINPHHLVHHAIDKATMHLEFITNGLHVPYTIILSPYKQQKELRLDVEEMKHLGNPFVIKPANTTGGGTGVILNAKTVEDVMRTRQQHPDDKYLLQKKISPKDLNSHRAWFRVYYAFGETILCWWDDMTHIYTPVSAEEEQQYALSELRNMNQTIHRICQLDFFSSEIAMTDDNTFIVVDYVNEICDMRLQSKYRNGAPDAVVHRIEYMIAKSVAEYVQQIAVSQVKG